MSETALARVDEKGLVPRTQGAVILEGALRQATEQRALLVTFVKDHMVENVDYGKIPGSDKWCLYKPGAEKLTELYRAHVDLDIDKETERWKSGFFYYRIKARIVSRDSGAVLGVGYGSCNSHESKYRWREAQRKCPNCAKATIFVSKEPGGGFFCWKKKGGCGAQFDQSAPAITSQVAGKIENPDIADLVNTILKMACKRAHVGAALQLAGCSDLFTQDLEDVEIPQVQEEAKKAAAPQAAKPPATPTKPEPEGDPLRCVEEGHRWGLKGTCLECGAKEQQQLSSVKPMAQASKQTPALRARAIAVWKAAQRAGFDLEAFQVWSTKILGRATSSAEWTDGDVALLEEAMATEAQKARDAGADG